MSKQVLAELTELTYYHLFGMTRADMLKIAQKHPSYGAAAGSLYSLYDQDEAMRDCMSAEALQALSDVEGMCSSAMRKITLWDKMSQEQRVAGAAYIVIRVCEGYLEKCGKVDPIWLPA